MRFFLIVVHIHELLIEFLIMNDHNAGYDTSYFQGENCRFLKYIITLSVALPPKSNPF
jgi:hypothetical protein